MFSSEIERISGDLVVKTESERPGKYIEAGLTVPVSIHETVCNYIIKNLAGGLILEDEEDSDLIGIKFYLPENYGLKFKIELLQFLNSIDSDLKFSESSIKTNEVPDIEWVGTFRDSIRPIFIDDVVVRPPWVSIPDKDCIDLIIEPKMAFGTGQHESTRLCIRAIQKYLKKGNSFFDLGCGNGILSILASKKNAKRVKGSDIDPIAIDNARENAVTNNVAGKIVFKTGSIEIAESDRPYDFFVANIIKETIMNLYDRIDKCTRPGGIVVLSGLLHEDEEPVVSKLKECGRDNFEITSDGQWIAFTVFK
ncbi:MAG TPA: 50S ribosomal protein L11 methyltransferase [candidate division Zixibacteria bacterium]|nr:50S ribosomal protein L11 methyltransferase [candidate division Zixibacteria bacterium]